METTTQRENGTVKWFSKEKGYGFISLPGNTEGVFVHYSQIMGKDTTGQLVPISGYRELFDGQNVEFEIEQCETRKGGVGVHAIRVVAIDQAAE